MQVLEEDAAREQAKIETALRTIFKEFGWDPDRPLNGPQMARLRQLYAQAEVLVAASAEQASPRSDGVDRLREDPRLRGARKLMATDQVRGEEMRIMLEASRRKAREARDRKRK